MFIQKLIRTSAGFGHVEDLNVGKLKSYPTR
jgi:hypothetical protein